MDYTSTETTGFFAMLGVMSIVYIALLVVVAIGLWKVFVKAGKPGWAAIIPFYNVYVLVEIVGRPIMFFYMFIGGALLSLIPLLGLIFTLGLLVLWFILILDTAKSFGKDIGYAVGLFLLPFIFIPMLGFGSSRYLGPAAAQPGAETKVI
ncbi:MAG TPA: DUF5684 domain-containing protein [Ignavibacteriales bacterium]|nr:DUF5684 domain-containing protein [Ignavibacteriales bacterium]